MNSDIKSRWVAALRSGEYRQAQSYLRLTSGKEERFCCLGVLCELAVEDGIVRRVADELPGGDGYVAVHLDDRLMAVSLLPQEVVEWAGLDENNPVVPITSGWDGNLEVRLAELNDSYGLSFLKIAAIIEEQL